MDEKERDITFSISFAIILLTVCVIAANFIMPKNCEFFSDNMLGPFACDTIGADCHPCEDRATATVASTIAGLGVCSLFLLPVVLYKLEDLRSRPIEQTKIFD